MIYSALTWTPWTGPLERSRTTAMCGTVQIGDIVAPGPGRPRHVWRIWVTGRPTTSVGSVRGLDAAVDAVESRFREFLEASGLGKR